MTFETYKKKVVIKAYAATRKLKMLYKFKIPMSYEHTRRMKRCGYCSTRSNTLTAFDKYASKRNLKDVRNLSDKKGVEVSKHQKVVSNFLGCNRVQER